MSAKLPLDMRPDGSYQRLQEALREAVEATAFHTGLEPGTIAAECLIAACIDQILTPGYAWAFRAMLDRAEGEEWGGPKASHAPQKTARGSSKS